MYYDGDVQEHTKILNKGQQEDASKKETEIVEIVHSENRDCECGDDIFDINFRDKPIQRMYILNSN